MLTFWSNCKLVVKLRAAFALMMMAFMVAIAGFFVMNTQIAALTTSQMTVLVPSRAEMRATTQHGTKIMVPAAATAAQHAATARAASLATRQLAQGIAEIDATARVLRDQAGVPSARPQLQMHPTDAARRPIAATFKVRYPA